LRGVSEGPTAFGPFITAIRKWRHVGGGIDAEGNKVGKPPELQEAELILGLCDRFHKLPSEVLAEPIFLLWLLMIEVEGKKEN
jgi:hypothetical protein